MMAVGVTNYRAYNADKAQLSPAYRATLPERMRLTAEEESELAHSYRQGQQARAILEQNPVITLVEAEYLILMIVLGEESREILITRNLRLVLKFARDALRAHLSFEDIVQEGTIGLLDAVRLWDPDRGSRFGTYASYWIRQRIRRYTQTSCELFQVPVHVTEKIAPLLRFKFDYYRDHGEFPTIDTMAKALGFTPELVQGAFRALESPYVHQEDLNSDNNEDFRTELEEADNGISPEEAVETSEERGRIRQYLSYIKKPRDRTIVEYRYGFDHVRERTLAETGIHFGITRERARQICDKAIRQIREALAEKGQTTDDSE